ncbi:hypothetical protein H634G_01644 [Metarhizium anisopliae BRIP 53293]|uniref:BZIP transcription factor n=1 Tax=Metarhizium anisopliae BRIP 53293 TaxID=1291518 RepID=A0A0D9PFE2_METAN|nr:hypothetical protein H634G_01644 [Metarhizium anisopliae BRIP 53293]
MSTDPDSQSNGYDGHTHPIERSDSSVSTSTSENNEPDTSQPVIHQPVPTRPRMPSRKSSGPLVVPRDSSEVGPVDPQFGPDDKPEKKCEGEILDVGGHAKALQDSLITIFNRIEAVREEHDKLDNNNKFLQKYIGDLMSTTKITSSGSRGKK